MSVWKKPKKSNGNGGNNCVEVAFYLDTVYVRDSNEPAGEHLRFSKEEWRVFVDAVKDGEFEPDGTEPEPEMCGNRTDEFTWPWITCGLKKGHPAGKDDNGGHERTLKW